LGAGRARTVEDTRKIEERRDVNFIVKKGFGCCYYSDSKSKNNCFDDLRMKIEVGSERLGLLYTVWTGDFARAAL
jgi:hypothetical protein